MYVSLDRLDRTWLCRSDTTGAQEKKSSRQRELVRMGYIVPISVIGSSCSLV